MELTRIKLEELLKWTKTHRMHLQRYVLSSGKEATRHALEFTAMSDKTAQHVAMVVQKRYLLDPSTRLEPKEISSIKNIGMYLQEYVTRLERFDNDLYATAKIIDKLTLLSELSCQLCNAQVARHGSFEERDPPRSRPITSHRASHDYLGKQRLQKYASGQLTGKDFAEGNNIAEKVMKKEGQYRYSDREKRRLMERYSLQSFEKSLEMLRQVNRNYRRRQESHERPQRKYDRSGERERPRAQTNYSPRNRTPNRWMQRNTQVNNGQIPERSQEKMRRHKKYDYTSGLEADYKLREIRRSSSRENKDQNYGTPKIRKNVDNATLLSTENTSPRAADQQESQKYEEQDKLAIKLDFDSLSKEEEFSEDSLQMMKKEEKSNNLRQTACFGTGEDERSSSKDSLDDIVLQNVESHEYSFGD